MEAIAQTMPDQKCKIIAFPQCPKKLEEEKEQDSEIIVRKKGEKKHSANYIREEELIYEIQSYLLHCTGKYGYRNYMIFLTGIETGRRCGDILKLKVSDVYDGKDVYNIVEYNEQKTNMTKDFAISEAFCNELKTYILRQGLQQNDYLFPTQKPNGQGEYVMTVRSYYNILQKVKKALHLEMRFSTHSMRKTFGRHHYNDLIQNQDLSQLAALDMMQQLLGHRSKDVTYVYLDLRDDERLNAVNHKTFCKGVDNL